MRISDWSSDVCSSDLGHAKLVEQSGRRRGDHRRDRDRKVTDAGKERGEHYPHPLGIGLFQRPVRLRIDILIAGENRAKSLFDAVRERQRLEPARHFDEAGVSETGAPRPITLGLRAATSEVPTPVMTEPRKKPTRQ